MLLVGLFSGQVRARWKVEDLARGQWQLVVTELPPYTSAQKVLEEIEELTNPKIRVGKKALTQEQIQLKQTVLAVLDTVRDESAERAVRIILEPRASGIDRDEFVNSARRRA
jgi:topoisomerase-4 subunit A